MSTWSLVTLRGHEWLHAAAKYFKVWIFFRCTRCDLRILRWVLAQVRKSKCVENVYRPLWLLAPHSPSWEQDLLAAWRFVAQYCHLGSMTNFLILPSCDPFRNGMMQGNAGWVFFFGLPTWGQAWWREKTRSSSRGPLDGMVGGIFGRGGRRCLMKVPCAIYFGVILMIDWVGASHHVALDTPLDRMSQRFLDALGLKLKQVRW